ncbi:hypothetical protein [Sphingomonas sp. BAUL-RG-20F-R05-02]|uniref:hypothetical protein n=1 Tax=unclassified Sphingomonas TaxID=196159 RepID=UPI00226A982F|nr:hypothetical protein [Sphingomonas sp. BAUL-RG-20F-R05-02]
MVERFGAKGAEVIAADHKFDHAPPFDAGVHRLVLDVTTRARSRARRRSGRRPLCW